MRPVRSPRCAVAVRSSVAHPRVTPQDGDVAPCGRHASEVRANGFDRSKCDGFIARDADNVVVRGAVPRGVAGAPAGTARGTTGTMSTRTLVWTAAWAALLALVVGCQKSEPTVASEGPVGSTAEALSGDSGSDAAPPPSPSIGSFAVYATEALEMNSGALITGCSVGVENTTGPFLGGGASAGSSDFRVGPDWAGGTVMSGSRDRAGACRSGRAQPYGSSGSCGSHRPA